MRTLVAKLRERAASLAGGEGRRDEAARTDLNGKARGYSYRILTVREAVLAAACGAWAVPPFQRNFVWSPEQVRDLTESLWRDYPIGSVLLWNKHVLPATTGEELPLWIVDGQQTITSLCILFGVKPHWWLGREGRTWEQVLKTCDIRFDVEAEKDPFFRVGTPSLRVTESSRFVPMPALLKLDCSNENGESAIDVLSRNIKERQLCAALSIEAVGAHFDRARAIAERPLLVTVLDHELDDALEIWVRLNGHGLRFRHKLLRLLLEGVRNRWHVLSA